MAAQPTTSNATSWGQIILIVVMGINAYALLEYAPLVPKTIVFMDDVHALKKQAETYEKTAADIMDAIKRIEKKFSFFEAEQNQRRR